MYCVGDIPVWCCIFTRRGTRAVYVFCGSVSVVRKVVWNVACDGDDVVFQFYFGYDVAFSIISVHDRGRFRVVWGMECCGLVVDSDVYAGDEGEDAGGIGSGFFCAD